MKSKLLTRLLKWSVLLIFWLILSGDFGFRTLLSGMLCSSAAIYFTEVLLKRYGSTPVWINFHYHIIWFLGIVFVEVFIAAYNHILRIISGGEKSVILDVELDIDDEFVIALIANAITLTPGSLTIGINGKTLTVLGFGETREDIEELRSVILNRFQKPFLARSGGGPRDA